MDKILPVAKGIRIEGGEWPPLLGFSFFVPVPAELSSDGKPVLLGRKGERWSIWEEYGKCHRGCTNVPSISCGCGIFGRYALPEGVPSFRVAAAILAYGKAICYQEGWLASRSRVVALLDDPELPLAEIGERYGVPVLPKEEFMAFSAEQGYKVPMTPEWRWVTEAEALLGRGRTITLPSFARV